MTGSSNSNWNVLPSRAGAFKSACDAVRGGGPIFVVGSSGIGCTTFSLQLMDRVGPNFMMLVGSKALSAIPFAALGVLASQLAGAPIGTTPTELVTGFGLATKDSAQWILLDRAEFVDEQSAAILRHFCAVGQIRLVITTSSVRSMPVGLRSLVSERGYLRIDLDPLSYDDARIVLSEALGGEVNSSTITTLLEHSGGHPLHLRELAFDAQASGDLVVEQNYWTLNRVWAPQGKRTADLINGRLNEQPLSVQKTLELLAVAGPLPLPIARRLAGADVDEAIDSELAQVELVSQNPATGQRNERLRLAPGLSPQLIVSNIGKSALRKYMETINEKLAWEEFDPESRDQFTRYRLEVGIPFPIAELITDVEHASNARRFTQVIALTNTVDQNQLVSALDAEKLLIARAEALYELGMPEAGLALLENQLPEGSAEFRFVAAKIAYASLGRLDIAEQILDPRPTDPPEMGAYLLLIRSRANKIVDHAKLREYSAMSEFRLEHRAQFLAHVLIEMSFEGLAEDAMAEYIKLSSSPEWDQWSVAARTELMFAFPALAFARGLNPASFTELSVRQDLHRSNTDHANVLVVIGMSYLETGAASQALATLEQAIGLLSIGDRYLVKGYAAALASYASILSGNKSKARYFLDMHRAEPEVSGQIMRPWAERCLVSVIEALEGRESARAHVQRLLSQATAFRRRGLTMRLLLEEWQCGLQTNAAQLSDVASEVQGPLAAILSAYASALEDPTEENVGQLVHAHVTAGQLLLAAQLAANASRRARDLGRRKTAESLFALSLEIVHPLGPVNTVALGRTPIDESVLTDREYAVCARAAAGATNQEISKELFISPRTVEGHLQRAYVKLGVTDRRQLLLN